MRWNRTEFAHGTSNPILPSLAKLGIHSEPVIWDSSAPWRSYDGIILRSTWDYWLKYPSFLAWISEMERVGIRVLNPPKILRENTRKTYLRRLESQGIPMLPTRWIEQGSAKTLHSVLSETGWKEVVLKPSVSGGAYRTYRLKSDEAPSFESKLKEIIQDAEALIQPLAPTVLSQGELSFLFYGGKFSHAAIKRGPEGEFRIQRTFGDLMPHQKKRSRKPR